MVSFVGLFCIRDLWFEEAYESKPAHTDIDTDKQTDADKVIHSTDIDTDAVANADADTATDTDTAQPQTQTQTQT